MEANAGDAADSTVIDAGGGYPIDTRDEALDAPPNAISTEANSDNGDDSPVDDAGNGYPMDAGDDALDSSPDMSDACDPFSLSSGLPCTLDGGHCGGTGCVLQCDCYQGQWLCFAPPCR
jgi:hypothetical protein